MNVAIICELNPFHKGHEAIFNYAKSCGCGPSETNTLTALMSGNFTQRGEPAFLDKWTRAEIAVKNGADCVLEFPSFFVQQSAQFFAEKAVDFLSAANMTDVLVFGSERGDIDFLKEVAEKRLSIDFSAILREKLDEGLTYPKAMEQALGVKLYPNEILGVEYIVALRKRQSPIVPVTFGMIRPDPQNSSSGKSPSGSAIRQCFSNDEDFDNEVFILFNDFIPRGAFDDLNDSVARGRYVSGLFSFDQFIIAKLRELGPSGIEDLPAAGNGLAQRIYDAACSRTDVISLINDVTDNAFTSSRVSRILASILTGTTETLLSLYRDANVPYLRVLAVKRGRDDILSTLASSETPLICGNIPKDYAQRFDYPASEILRREILSTDLYTLGFSRTAANSFPAHLELRTPLIKA